MARFDPAIVYSTHLPTVFFRQVAAALRCAGQTSLIEIHCRLARIFDIRRGNEPEFLMTCRLSAGCSMTCLGPAVAYRDYGL